MGYMDRFAKQTDYPSLAAAQFCALIAPIVGGLGVFAVLFDFCVINFSGSFMIGTFLLLSAAGIQAGAFALIADPAFWYVH